MNRKIITTLLAFFIALTVLPVKIYAEQIPDDESAEQEEEIITEAEDSIERVPSVQPNSERSDEGTAYAILCDNGDFVFFRSNETYKNGETVTATDIAGNSYVGTVYAGIEKILYFSSDTDQPWYEKRKDIKRVLVADGQVIKPNSLSCFFAGLSSLTEAYLSGFDTSEVGSMSYLFWNCSNLEKADLTGLDTSSVTSMSYMFQNCKNLKSIDLSGFDTSSVENMRYMFSECSSLSNLDLRSFDTSNVTDMRYMFYMWNSTSLTNLDISSFNTSKVKDMAFMFSGCKQLTALVSVILIQPMSVQCVLCLMAATA